MKLSAKYINITIFLVLLAIFLVVSPLEKLSTNLLSLLPQNEETKLLKIYQKFQSSREILVAIKSEDVKKIKTLKKRVLQNEFIEEKKSFFTNSEFRNYIKKYQFYLQNFDKKNLSLIEKKLKDSYQNLISNPYYYSINQKDPLELFSQKRIDTYLTFKNGQMYLKDYGYMAVFNFKDGTNFKEVYEVFQNEIKDDVKVFGPIFYFVENSLAIKSQVNILIFIAISLLIILYVLMLKNTSLLFHTIMTLLSSSLVALLSVTFFWSEVSIFVMVFGIAISTIAIDYMFHHYFCGFYEKNRGFNKAVFYGFLSTFLAFLIISFVDFPFIKQVSIYALVSLSFSYIVFAFLFPFMSFTCKGSTWSLPALNQIKNYKFFVLILLIVIGYSSLHVKMDLNIKNLDYKNVKLKELESFFALKLKSNDKIPFIIKAKTLDKLIEKSSNLKTIIPVSNLLSKNEFEQRKKQFKEINFFHIREMISQKADAIGFRKNFFVKSYPEHLLYPEISNLNMETVKTYGFDVYYDGKDYYSYGFANKESEIDGVYFENSAQFFKNSIKSVGKELMICGFIILFCVIFILYKVTKENFFKALSFILFPISLIFFIISFSQINILQIFMLFVIVSLSIDYGIYMSQKDVNQNSKKAILFSLMSTFAGFGVLVFSSIGVLFYIGQVATLGLLALFILLVIGKR